MKTKGKARSTGGASPERRRPGAVSAPEVAQPSSALLAEVRDLVLEARHQTARAVNAGLTLLYWQVGDRIRREILRERRAEYGAEILQTLSAKLEAEFGRGFSKRNLANMVRFAEAFPDRQIVSTPLRELSWPHFLPLIYLKDPLQRDFYAEMSRVERWSTRTLEERIQSMLHERTALSKKPKQLIDKERQPEEDKPIGIILCAGKKRETVEVLELEPRGIHVAEYLTELPPRKLLEKRLRDAVLRARLRLQGRQEDAGRAGTPDVRRKRGRS